MVTASLASLVPLTQQIINEAIDSACHRAKGGVLRRAEGADFVNGASPFLFGVVKSEVADQTRTAVLSTFYIAYSTWDGRVLCVDQIGCDDSNDALIIYHSLADVALNIYCSRLNWQHFDRETTTFPGTTTQPETLHGWLTLHWDKDTMQRFLGDANHRIDLPTSISSDLRAQIEGFLSVQLLPPNFRLKLAGSEDLESIHRLVQGLADYEKEPDAVNVTIDHYRIDGFSRESPLFYCLLLESRSDDFWYTCGMAFCYVGYKLDAGRFIYLEDLFIEEPHRKNGAGKSIMQALAGITLSLGCARLVWQALEWNTPALKFYDKIGAKVVSGLRTTRFARQNLNAFHGSLPSGTA